MKLVARVTRPLEPPLVCGRCDVELVTDPEGAARGVVVARGLEYGDVRVDEAGTRSLSEFEVTLFEALEPGAGARLRVRRWHCYEGATSTLRDVWLEAHATAGGTSLHASGPLPSALLRPAARAWWRGELGLEAPRQE